MCPANWASQQKAVSSLAISDSRIRRRPPRHPSGRRDCWMPQRRGIPLTAPPPTTAWPDRAPPVRQMSAPPSRARCRRSVDVAPRPRPCSRAIPAERRRRHRRRAGSLRERRALRRCERGRRRDARMRPRPKGQAAWLPSGRRALPVSSVEPLSATMTSHPPLQLWRERASSCASMVFAALNAGMTMEIATASVTRPCYPWRNSRLTRLRLRRLIAGSEGPVRWENARAGRPAE